jgi:hypothetical protein
MARIVITFGFVLILLGAGAYIASGMASVTALIPAFFGAAIAVIGGVATRPAWTRGAVMAAAVTGALGAAGSLSRIVPKLARGEAVSLDLAAGAQIAMALLSLALVVVCAAWLLKGRRPAGPTAP